MLNITKTASGFIFKNIPYSFESFIVEGEEGQESVNNLKYNNTQFLIGTDRGILFFDLSVTIEGLSYENSSDWVTALFN
jgi:hypothetical protein